MRILDRYLANQVYVCVGFVLLVLLSIWSFLDFIQELANINVGHYGVGSALVYVLMLLPGQLYEFFPIAALIGCLFGLGRLARSSQLTVMRASGVSVARLTLSVVKAAVVMALIMLIVGEWLAPALQNRAEHLKAAAMGHHYHLNASQLWLRQGDHMINIAKLGSDGSLLNVRDYQFAGNRLQSLTVAKRAFYRDGQWWMRDARTTLFTAKQLTVMTQALLPLAIHLPPQDVMALNQDTDQQTVWSLWQTMRYRERNGLDTSQYQLVFWQRLVQPITTIVLICLGIPFMFGSLRMTSMGTRLLIGIAVGFVFYMLNRIFGPLTVVYDFPPSIAALMPTGCFLLAYLYLLKRRV